jgi:hypothetical protein
MLPVHVHRNRGILTSLLIPDHTCWKATCATHYGAATILKNRYALRTCCMPSETLLCASAYITVVLFDWLLLLQGPIRDFVYKLLFRTSQRTCELRSNVRNKSLWSNFRRKSTVNFRYINWPET